MLLVLSLSLTCLFVSIGSAVSSELNDEGISLSCEPNKPCKAAFMSHNPVILMCPNLPPDAAVSWQYIDLSDSGSKAKTFIGARGLIIDQTALVDLRSKSTLQSGNLKIRFPTVKNMGIYICKDGEKTMAYYELDFQDVHSLYVSHAGLGQKVLKNATVNLGNGTEVSIFTIWSNWQSCDRCGSPGERKRLGFCYALITKMSKPVEEPLPCGLMFLKVDKKFLKRGPEMQIETCSITCSDKAYPDNDINEVPILLLDNFLTQLQAKTTLTCPSSSIYSPVYWKKGSRSYTYLKLIKENGTRSLDITDGGGTLIISVINLTDAGDYKCYINNRLHGRFQLEVGNPHELDRTVVDRTYRSIESIIIGLSTILLLLILMSFVQAFRSTPRVSII